MDDRGLAALTAAILLLLQFHFWFLPASTAVRDPLLAGTRYQRSAPTNCVGSASSWLRSAASPSSRRSRPAAMAQDR